jgi:hypothetical protein
MRALIGIGLAVFGIATHRPLLIGVGAGVTHSPVRRRPHARSWCCARGRSPASSSRWPFPLGTDANPPAAARASSFYCAAGY